MLSFLLWFVDSGPGSAQINFLLNEDGYSETSIGCLHFLTSPVSSIYIYVYIVLCRGVFPRVC